MVLYWFDYSENLLRVHRWKSAHLSLENILIERYGGLIHTIESLRGFAVLHTILVTHIIVGNRVPSLAAVRNRLIQFVTWATLVTAQVSNLSATAYINGFRISAATAALLAATRLSTD